ncbi:MAG: TatD family hydrolase, partial [Clostridia bacterium]|nr:TatD family hydrolase [Clostridia bacterium]
MYTDTHCHFSDRTEENAEATYRGAINSGVDRMIDVAFSVDSSFKCRDFAVNREGAFFTVGVHPDAADEITDETVEKLRILSRDKKCVAIGEIGLDFHYDDCKPESVQKEAFARQIELAYEEKLPVSVHTRDGTEKTLDVL